MFISEILKHLYWYNQFKQIIPSECVVIFTFTIMVRRDRMVKERMTFKLFTKKVGRMKIILLQKSSYVESRIIATLDI